MIRRTFAFLVLLTIVSCKSELDEITLNDNPYDSAYEGPKVVVIDSVVSKIIGPTKYNYIYLTATVQLFDKVNLFVNGTKIKTISRTDYSASPSELITHFPVFTGNTFTYQVQLGQNDGVTDLSDPVNFTTP